MSNSLDRRLRKVEATLPDADGPTVVVVRWGNASQPTEAQIAELVRERVSRAKEEGDVRDPLYVWHDA